MQMQVDSLPSEISLCNPTDDLATQLSFNILELIVTLKNLSVRGMSD